MFNVGKENNLIIANRDPTISDTVSSVFWLNFKTKELFQFVLGNKWDSVTKQYIENNQPERSKREDGINNLRCGHCENEYDICSDPNHMYRCGALNTMET